MDFYGTYPNSLAASKIAEQAARKGVPLEQHEVDWVQVFQLLFDLLARRGGVLRNAGYRLRVVREPLDPA